MYLVLKDPENDSPEIMLFIRATSEGDVYTVNHWGMETFLLQHQRIGIAGTRMKIVYEEEEKGFLDTARYGKFVDIKMVKYEDGIKVSTGTFTVSEFEKIEGFDYYIIKDIDRCLKIENGKGSYVDRLSLATKFATKRQAQEMIDSFPDNFSGEWDICSVKWQGNRMILRRKFSYEGIWHGYENRDGEFIPHREDGPAYYSEDGKTSWIRRGKLHRREGPAQIFPGGKSYCCYLNGMLHCEDGPAKFTDWCKEYYYLGRLHRLNKPAVETRTYSVWYKNGIMHNEEGPAWECNTEKYWYFESKLHNPNGPAVWKMAMIHSKEVDEEEWWIHGVRHREDGPAKICQNGSRLWFYNGVLHRIDGPAVEINNGTLPRVYEKENLLKIDIGTKIWFQDGKRHRIGAPAYQGRDGTLKWYWNGELHRDDGPAVEKPDGTMEWWIDGIRREDDPSIKKYCEENFEWDDEEEETSLPHIKFEDLDEWN